MRIALAISLGVNLVLGILYYLRSAVNEIVKQWWSDRRERRRKKQELLMKLHAGLETLPGYYFLWQCFSLLATRPSLTQQEYGHAMKTAEDSSIRMATTLDFVRQNRFQFSPTIQGQLDQLHKAMQLKGMFDPKSSQDQTEKVYDSVDELLKAIRAEIEKDS